MIKRIFYFCSLPLNSNPSSNQNINFKMSNLFKVPNKSGKSQTIYVIGIIDASGSMTSYWKWVADFWNQNIPKENCITITFDTKPRICASNTLD